MVRPGRRRRPNWTLVHLEKARANKAKARAKASKDSTAGQEQGQEQRLVECWNCGKRGHYSFDCWSKKNTHKGGLKGKHKHKNADDHNLDSKPSIDEPEVEIDEFSMPCLNVDTLQEESEKTRGSE